MSHEPTQNNTEVKQFIAQLLAFKQALTNPQETTLRMQCANFLATINEGTVGIADLTPNSIPDPEKLQAIYTHLKSLENRCPNATITMGQQADQVSVHLSDLLKNLENSILKLQSEKKRGLTAASAVPPLLPAVAAVMPAASADGAPASGDEDNAPSNVNQPGNQSSPATDEDDEEESDTHSTASEPASPATGGNPVATIPFTPDIAPLVGAPALPPPPPHVSEGKPPMPASSSAAPGGAPASTPPRTTLPFELKSVSRSGSGAGGMNFKAACEALGYEHKDLGSGQEQGSKADDREVVTYENSGASEKWTVQKTQEDRYEVAAKFLILQMGKDSFSISQPSSKEGQLKLQQALAKVFDTVKTTHAGKPGASFPDTVHQFLGNISWSSGLSPAEACAPAKSAGSPGRSVDPDPRASKKPAGSTSTAAASPPDTTVAYATGSKPH